METKDILLIIFPFISGVISAWITYLFTIRIKKSENMLKFKEEKYANLLVAVQGFFKGTKDKDELIKKFIEEQFRSWLYASDNVVRATNNIIKSVSPDKDETPFDKLLGEFVLEMRQDLLGKTKLKNDDFKYTQNPD